MAKKQSTVSRRAFLSNAAIIGASSTLGASSLLTSCVGGSNENKLIPLRPASEIYIPDLPTRQSMAGPLKRRLSGAASILYASAN